MAGSVESLTPIYLSLAVVAWVSGFDIIYACQDYKFDKDNSVHSIPSKFGLDTAIQISRFLHFLTPLLLYFTAESAGLGLYFRIGIVLVIAILFYEQYLVKAALQENNMKKLDKAFFELNSWVSVLIFTTLALDLLVS